MLSFKKIELSDKSLFEEYSLCHGYHNLEASFANIYLWRKAWNIKMATDDIALYLLLDNGQGQRFMLPPFLNDCDINIGQGILRCEEFLKKEFNMPLYLKGVTPQFKEKIETDCPDQFIFTPDRANFEYVYRSEDLANLKGKKYHAKRNHINKLISNHEFEYRTYTTEYYDQCIDLQKQWIQNKGEVDESYEQELNVTKEALTHIDTLGLKCGLLFVDGELQAFSIGEKHGDDMAIIHIEKANPNIQGTFPLINREFVRNEWMDVEFINREEDMGLEGLRRAKMSYNPVFLLEKYICERK